MKRIYVSCDVGNDGWSGAVPTPNAERTDGPLRTLTAAQTAVRMWKRDQTGAEPMEVVLRGGGYTTHTWPGIGATAEPVEVVLAGGCYHLEQTWRFGADDSGYGVRGHFDGRTWPVTWRAAEGETVTISGGRVITGWQHATLNGRAVWRADVPWLDSEARFFRQLWINGERRLRASLPKQGAYRVAATPDASFVNFECYRRGTNMFGFRPGDFSAAWSNIPAIDVQFRGLWLNPRVRLLSIDEGCRTVRLDRYTQLQLANAPGDGLDYVIENVLEALTEPGEWCLDPAARCVWYRPRAGEKPDAVETVAGGIERLLEMEGARFLRFENIAFEHGEWSPYGTEAIADQPASQAAAKVRGAVLVGRGCEGITFEKCRIAHVSGYGLECADGAVEVSFRDGMIHDLGAGGVKIWHGCRRCVIEGGEIFDGGHIWLTGVGVLVGRACGNTVRRCHIHDFYYSGISVGWNWGYSESDAYGNVIEWNHIHDLGKGLLSDMGGVYLLGPATGTRVRHNRIHDIRSLRYGGWAMYPDEGSSDLLIENNLCYNTDREVFHQHYGRNNRVRNNIFAYGGDAVLAYTRMEGHLGLIFEHNLIVARGTPIVKRVDDVRWRKDCSRFDGNLYWCEDGAVRFEGGWRNLGTQPIKDRLADEAPRFLPLPANGATVRTLHVQSRPGLTVGDAGEFRFEHDGRALSVTGRFAGAPGVGEPGQPPWGDWRAHIEVFLKPFALCPAMVRCIVTADGETAVTWYGCDEPRAFEWKHAVVPVAEGWSVALTVPLEGIQAWVRKALVIPDSQSADWRAMAAVALPVETLDFAAWQRHAGDGAGMVADPLFVDPHQGDFRLRPDSPALGTGFVPFACGPDG